MEQQTDHLDSHSKEACNVPEPLDESPAKSVGDAPLSEHTGQPGGRPCTDQSAPYREKNIERILDIELPVVLNLGETGMLLKDVLQLSAGSIIQLDRAADDPITLTVNNKIIARGELVIVDGNYGIKITDVESTADRIRSLG